MFKVRMSPVAWLGGEGEGGGGGVKIEIFATTPPPSLWRLVLDIHNTNVHCQRHYRISPRNENTLARIISVRQIENSS